MIPTLIKLKQKSKVSLVRSNSFIGLHCIIFRENEPIDCITKLNHFIVLIIVGKIIDDDLVLGESSTVLYLI